MSGIATTPIMTDTAHLKNLDASFVMLMQRLVNLTRNVTEDSAPSNILVVIRKNSNNEEIIVDTEGKDNSGENFPFHASFMTSTPQKVKYECEECINGEQCTDCFFRQHDATGQLNVKGHHKKPRRVHF